jgi:hypothetical protein
MTTALTPVLVPEAPDALAPLAPDLHLSRSPEIVLAEARRAARALADVLDAKPRKVVLNGEVYLEFEDWQTLGRFYGISAKVVETHFVEFANMRGFDARAVALRSDGAEISAAEASCLTDEPHWRTRPLFQLRSMAQTRACAKVLRNVLAWVVVLAGYKATPAEELIPPGEEARPPAPASPPPAGALETVTISVGEIRQKATSNGGTKFTIITPDRIQYATFRRELAEMAKAAQEAGAKLEAVFRETKFGREIITLRDLASPEPVF